MINHILDLVNRSLSAWLLIPALIFAGIYFSFKTRFVQFRFFVPALKSLAGKADKGKLSPFQSLMISTASRIGVGHIAGIASAIMIGGPGAVFWMWVMALFGSASAFIESTLAQIYKINSGNSFIGGPSYYIQRALGKRWLGVLFSCLLIAGYAYGFNTLQAFQLSSSLEYYIPDYRNTFYPVICGAILALITVLVIWGGVHRIGFISSYIVPVMAVLYMLLGVFICVKNFYKIPAVFGNIIDNAFDTKAIFGAMFYKSPLMMGIKRGLFSNEAGMGSSPNAAAIADVPHPVIQGLAQSLSVFIDTMLICGTTAFIVLLSDVKVGSAINEIPFVQQAVYSQVGSVGIHIIAFSIFAFAFTSIIGNYCYAETNIRFIKDNKLLLNLFRATCVVTVFLGTQTDAVTAWNLADILMSVMAIVNIVVILMIGNIAINALKHYRRLVKSHEHISFKASDIGIHNTDVWK